MSIADCEVFENYELKMHTSFKIGGCARRAYFPKTTDELTELLKTLDNPLVLGGCSNVLISDEGIDGDVILTTKMNQFSFNGNRVYSMCGVKVPKLSKEALEHSLSGFEFMIGFPGTVGGAVCMNASAHSQSVSDSFFKGRVFDFGKKEVIELSKEDMKFGYRNSVLQTANYILIDAEFELRPDEKETISAVMQRNLEFRKEKQPNLAQPNAGSVFRNPTNDSAGRLLEKAGVKGIKQGGASVWQGHANFIINDFNASSKDVTNLVCKMYNMVKEKYTIELVPEIKFIGRKSKEEAELWNMMLKK